MKKIEITVEVCDLAMGQLISAFEKSDCVGLVSKEIITFEVEDDIDTGVWLTPERSKEFENKMNEGFRDKYLSYKVKNIKVGKNI